MLEDYLDEEFALLDKVSVPDPMGGIMYKYQEGAHFFGQTLKDNSTEMKIAQQSGAKDVYTLVVLKPLELERKQLFRRLSDNADFTVTSPTRDMASPEKSGLKFSQATVERVTL